MCNECHQNPCHPRCPNAEEKAVVYYCGQCGFEIYEGDNFYDINTEIWCGSCIEDCKHIAEREEPEFYEECDYE